MVREQESDHPKSITVREARRTLLEFASVLEKWSERLEAIAAGIPDPRYEEETDAPLNDAAHIQGLMRAILFDDLPALQRIARTAAAGLD